MWVNWCQSSSTSESRINSGEVEKRAKKRKFCHHCNDFVSSSTFYHHRALFSMRYLNLGKVLVSYCYNFAYKCSRMTRPILAQARYCFQYKRHCKNSGLAKQMVLISCTMLYCCLQVLDSCWYKDHLVYLFDYS